MGRYGRGSMSAGRRSATWILGPLFAVAAVLAMHGLDHGATSGHANVAEAASHDHNRCDDCPESEHLVVLCVAVIAVGAFAAMRERRNAGLVARLPVLVPPALRCRVRRRPTRVRPPAWVRLEVILC